jgi:hypothetical protein
VRPAGCGGTLFSEGDDIFFLVTTQGTILVEKVATLGQPPADGADHTVPLARGRTQREGIQDLGLVRYAGGGVRG